MDVLEATRVTRGPSQPAQPVQPPVSRVEAPAEVETRTATLAGIQWTCLAEFESLLAAQPADLWRKPQSHGGTRVKSNPRRSVWRLQTPAGAFYAKYFFAGDWRGRVRNAWRGPDCLAEWRSGLYALRFALGAPRPVGYAEQVEIDDQPASLLVTQALEPARPLSAFWLALLKDDDARRGREDRWRLIERLAELIARAHQAGFAHLDLHAANVLVLTRGPRHYAPAFVDLQSARLDAPLPDELVVRNLTQLNQWFRRHSSSADRLRFLRAYCRWRNEYEHAFQHGRALRLSFPELVAALRTAADRHARRLWAQRDRSALRDGRYFSRLQLPGGWRGHAVRACKRGVHGSRSAQLQLSGDWWREALADPLRLCRPPLAEICKDSHSALVTRCELTPPEGEPIPVIVKRPRSRDGRRRLRNLLAPSRSLRGWRVGCALLNRDLGAARPLAVVERRLGPIVLDSVLLTEVVERALDLESWLERKSTELAPRAWARCKRRNAAVLARFVRRLHQCGLTHRDCKASNILVTADEPPELLWIDLDGIFRTQATQDDGWRALARLWVSLPADAGVTRTDCARFLKAYCARFGGSRDAWRDAWRHIAALAQAKRAQAETRRAWKLRRYGRV